MFLLLQKSWRRFFRLGIVVCFYKSTEPFHGAAVQFRVLRAHLCGRYIARISFVVTSNSPYNLRRRRVREDRIACWRLRPLRRFVQIGHDGVPVLFLLRFLLGIRQVLRRGAPPSRRALLGRRRRSGRVRLIVRAFFDAVHVVVVFEVIRRYEIRTRRRSRAGRVNSRGRNRGDGACGRGSRRRLRGR